MSASSAGIAAKLLHLHSYDTTAVHEVCDTCREARWNFPNRYLLAVCDGEIEEIDPTLIPFSDEF
jgi:hypothetical protein